MILQLALLATVVVVSWLAPAWAGDGTVRHVAGVALLTIGLGTGLAAARSLGAALTPFPRPRDDAPVVARGPYRLVRHPIYSALVLCAVGVSLLGSPWALIVTAVVMVFFALKARREEAMLLHRDSTYADYCTAVRWKFFPGVW